MGENRSPIKLMIGTYNYKRTQCFRSICRKISLAACMARLLPVALRSAPATSRPSRDAIFPHAIRRKVFLSKTPFNIDLHEMRYMNGTKQRA